MNTKIITSICIAIATLLLVGWDLFVNFNKVQGDTISEILASWIKGAPILAVVLGVVCGHFVGNFPTLKPALDFIAEHPIIAFSYGVIGGFFFWNMGR